LAYPAAISAPHIRKVSLEHFREVNGSLLNGKRRTKQFLSERFQAWDFEHLSTEDDESWTEEMEAIDSAAERGDQGLVWLLSERDEEWILLVLHGGILRYAMNIHPLIHVVDGRSDDKRTKEIKSRFDNCEVRRYCLSWKEDCNVTDLVDGEQPTTSRKPILLTQLDH
jgi:broad specificity phosphatase PhoE